MDELPTIVFDHNDLMITGSSCWSLTRKQVVEALEEYGSFRAIYSVISPEEDSSFFNSLRDLFDLPKETKLRFIPETPFDGYGYVTGLPNLPLYESMGMADALNSQNVQNLAKLMWPPNGNPTFCETYRLHTKKMEDLNIMVRKMVFEAYGVDKYFVAHVKATNNHMRLNKYGAPMSTGTEQLGSISHYDTYFLTILHENGVQGLQVKTKSGDHWINGVNCSGSSFVVIAGESFLGWSNGRIYSPLHRVMSSGLKPRYSIGLFASEKGLVEAPSELVDDQHPRLFRPFDRVGLVNAFKTRFASTADLSLPILITDFAL